MFEPVRWRYRDWLAVRSQRGPAEVGGGRNGPSDLVAKQTKRRGGAAAQASFELGEQLALRCAVGQDAPRVATQLRQQLVKVDLRRTDLR